MTTSQLFAFNGAAGPLALQPQNKAGTCLVVKGDTIDVADCDDDDANQSFTIGSAAADGGDNNGNDDDDSDDDDDDTKNNDDNDGAKSTSTCTRTTRTVTVIATAEATPTAPAETDGPGAIPTVNPTEPVPVSRAGGTLQPTAAAEAHQRDETATRAFSEVSIRAPNGQCLFVDPTAGDFRQNLIPISLVDCTGAPNEKWDVITEGKHNQPSPNRPPSALIVSTLVSRRPRSETAHRRSRRLTVSSVDPGLHQLRQQTSGRGHRHFVLMRRPCRGW